MALIKCPDCEKMISSKVESCPFCGCPKEYLEQSSERSEEIDSQVTKEQDDIPLQKEKITFTLGNVVLEYPKALELYASMFGQFEETADKDFSIAWKKYEDAGSLENALNVLEDYTRTTISEVVSKITKFLYEEGVIISERDFCSKYDISYQSNFDYVRSQYQEAISEQQEMQRYRNMEKASRARWEGGGFGIKGAMKGAAKAGMLNAGSDLLHSFGDISKASQDQKAFQDNLNAIYKNERNQSEICNAIYICIHRIYNGLVKELKRIGYFKETLQFDVAGARNLYEATMKYAKSDEEKLQNLVEALKLYPGNEDVTDALIPLLRKYPQDQFGVWLEFWKLEYRYPDYKEKRQEGLDFDEFLSKQGIREFDFGNYSADNYLKLRGWMENYYKNYGMERMPEYSMCTDRIRRYYDGMGMAMTEYKIIEWVPQNYNIFQFMVSMKNEREGLPHSVLPYIWIMGDEKADIAKSVYNLVERNHTRILMYYDNSLFHNGKNGILVTMDYIYGLKKQIKINLNEIESIQSAADNSIEIIGNQHQIVFKDEILKNDAAKIHFANILRIICVRYAGNAKLWSEGMSTPKPEEEIHVVQAQEEEKGEQSIKNETISDQEIQCPNCNKKIKSGTKFCNFCGTKIEDKRICEKCGKQIAASAKFCNFCGATIEEEK